MASRYDQPVANDYSMQHYVPEYFIPNFAAWDETLGQYQKDYDVTTTLAETAPDAAQFDQESLQAYLAENQQLVDSLVESYVKDVSLGRAQQADAIRKIKRDWQPGGRADRMQQRKQQYAGLVSKYDELYKDSPSFMKAYAYDQISKSVRPNDLTQDISDPNISPYINIQEEFYKYKDQIDPSLKSVSFVNGRYIDTQTNEEVEPWRIQQAFNKFIQNPRYAQQLGAETWLVESGVNKDEYIANLNTGIDAKIDENTSSLTKITELLASSKQDDRKLGQKMLSDAGFNTGSIDGVVGKNTIAAQKAYEEAINKANETNTKSKLDPTIDQETFRRHLQGNVVNNYSQEWEAMFGRTEKMEKKADEYQLALFKHGLSLDRMKQQISLVGGLSADPWSPGIVTADKPVQLDQNFDASKQAADEAMSSAETLAAQVLSAPELTQLFGGVMSYDKAAAIVQAYEQSRDGQGIVDLNTFRSTIGKIDRSFANIDEAGMKELYAYLNTGGQNALSTSLTQIGEAKARVQGLDNYEMGLTQTYLMTEGKENLNELRDKLSKIDPKYASMSEEELLKNTQELAKSYKTKQKEEVAQAGYSGTSGISFVRPTMSKAEIIANDFLGGQRKGINKAVSENPEAYKSQTAFRYSTTDTKAPMGKVFTEVISDFNNHNGAGYLTPGHQDIAWLDVNTNQSANPDATKELKVTDVSISTGAERPEWIITATSGGKELRTNVQIPDTQLQQVKQSARIHYLQASQEGNSTVAEQMVKIVRQIDHMSGDKTSTAFSETTPLTPTNSSQRTFKDMNGNGHQFQSSNTPHHTEYISNGYSNVKVDVWKVNSKAGDKYIITYNDTIVKFENGEFKNDKSYGTWLYPSLEKAKNEITGVSITSDPNTKREFDKSTMDKEYMKDMILNSNPYLNDEE